MSNTTSETFRDKIAELLDGDMAVTRVWEAWQVGTMTEEDFVPLEETERVDELFALFEAEIQERVKEAEKRGVAWAIKEIDDMHFNTPDKETFIGDSLFKGIKNSLRDRCKLQAGYDPAPSYPIHAELTKEGKS